jgi:hypothetical protein
MIFAIVLGFCAFGKNQKAPNATCFGLKKRGMPLDLKVPFPTHDYCQKHGMPLG